MSCAIQSSSLLLSQLCGVTSSAKARGPILSRDQPASCRCPEQWREVDAFAEMRKRLVQQRFKRVGCLAAINVLHRDFQGQAGCCAPMVIPQTNRSILRHQHRDHLVAVAAVDEKIIVQGENDGVFVKFGKAHEAGIGE